MKPITLLFLIFLSSFHCMHAQGWKSLGPDDTNLPTREPVKNLVITTYNNTPYIAYIDFSHNQSVSVQKFNGNTWEYVGAPGFSSPYADFVNIEIDANGQIYVAYQDWADTFRVKVKKFNGTTWNAIDSLALGKGGYISMKLYNGQPYVSYSDDSQQGRPTVKKYNGTNWVNVGTPGFHPIHVLRSSMNIDKSGLVYFSFSDWLTYGVIVYKYDGTNWTKLDSAGNTYPLVGINSIVFDANDTPFIAYRDVFNQSNATVKKFDGTGWITVSSNIFSAPQIGPVQMCIDANDTLFVAGLVQDNGGLYQNEVRKFDGTNWVNISQGWLVKRMQEMTLTLDGKGMPYVGYVKNDITKRGGVKKYNGNSWQSIGCDDGTENDDYDISKPVVAVDGKGIQYMSYRKKNRIFNTVLKVKKFDSNEWIDIYDNVDDSLISNLSFVISSKDIPYVAYLNNDVIKVMKYNGTSWSLIGTAGFADVHDFFSLSITSDDVPYLAFKNRLTSKASVMKFDGTTWVNVGMPGISTGTIEDIVIKIGRDNVPFICYADKVNWLFTIKKFENNLWNDIGSIQGVITSPIFFLDDANTAYVAYKTNSGYTALVKKLINSSWIDLDTVGIEFNNNSNNFDFTINGYTPYIVYTSGTDSSSIKIKRHDGSKWVDQGHVSSVHAQSPSIAIRNDKAIVTYMSRGIFAKSNSLPNNINFNEKSAASLRLYPNPTSEKLNIFLEEAIENPILTISDMAGRIILVKVLGSVHTGLFTIPINNLSAGIYIVKLTSGSNVLTNKLIVSH